jgi:hypothetical protein
MPIAMDRADPMRLPLPTGMTREATGMGALIAAAEHGDMHLSEVQPASGFLLAGLLWCAGCHNRLHALVLASGERSYDCRNGCRMHRLKASAVERQALAAARTSLLGRTGHLSLDPPRLAVRRAFDRIVIGGSDTDLQFKPEVADRRGQARLDALSTQSPRRRVQLPTAPSRATGGTVTAGPSEG